MRVACVKWIMCLRDESVVKKQHLIFPRIYLGIGFLMGVGLQGTNIVSNKEAVRQERGVGSASILYQIVMLLSIGWRSNVLLLYGEHHSCSS